MDFMIVFIYKNMKNERMITTKILDKLSKPPKHKHTVDLSKEHIEKSAKEFDELEIPPEAKAQLEKEKEMGYHIGHR